MVGPGTPLVEVGDPSDLEVVVDVLSVDAVKVKPGAEVYLERWGGDRTLVGRVRLVEPSAFTKISSLGVEEQRVNVILEIVSPRADWAMLGHGYQVDVRIVLWEGNDVLKVPLTALFREGDDWALFVSEGGLASKRRVELGYRNADEAQILSGLDEGETIVVYPSEGIDDGSRIAGR